MCERELETEQNCNILTPTLLAITVFLSCSPVLLQGGLGTSLSGCWFSLPHLIFKLVWSPKLTDFLSSPSYIIVQSPTQYLPITGHRNVSLPPSLEWHVWTSSSGNNCHAVHRSLSSSASVWLYHGILTLSHIVSQACPHQWNMHFCCLWNGMFGGVGGQYTTKGNL